MMRGLFDPDPTAETVRRYDEFAEVYAERWQGSDPVVAHRAIFSARLPGPRVLDLGCGPGRDARSLTELGREVTGVDLSRRLLALARDHAPEARFLRMDMRDLAFAPESFDGIWACASFLHVPRRQALGTMWGIARRLKPGGILYLSVKEGTEEMEEGFDARGVYYTYYQIEDLMWMMRIFDLWVKRWDRTVNHDTFLNVFARRER